MGCCESKEPCCICLELIESSQKAQVLPCGHSAFHKNCILEALKRDSKCPLCRTEVVSCDGVEITQKRQQVAAAYADDMPVADVPDEPGQEQVEGIPNAVVPAAAPESKRGFERVPLMWPSSMQPRSDVVTPRSSIHDLKLDKATFDALHTFIRNFAGVQHADKDKSHSLLICGPGVDQNIALQTALCNDMAHYGLIKIGTDWRFRMRTHPYYRHVFWISGLHRRLANDEKLGPAVEELFDALHEDDSVLVATSNEPWKVPLDLVLRAFETVVHLPGGKKARRRTEIQAS